MEKSPEIALAIWIFLSVTTGLMWVLLQYSRNLWDYAQASYLQILYLKHLGLLSVDDKECNNLEGKDSSQDDRDEAQS
jgi:hypothetical protein